MKKIITIALLSVFVITNISAQNTGPLAPEAAMFTPMGMPDLVNLLTGDFSYSLPLLEVPGPEGGYPVVLGYRGGIGMDQEATWVGLGWNINPGAINRSVNNFPDDGMDYVIKTLMTAEDEFEGWSFTTGVTLGYNNGGISLGLSSATTWSYVKGREGKDIQFENQSLEANIGQESTGIGISAGFNIGEYGIQQPIAGISAGSIGYQYSLEDKKWALGVSIAGATLIVGSDGANVQVKSGVGYGYTSISMQPPSSNDISVEQLQSATLGTQYFIFTASWSYRKLRVSYYQVENVYGYGTLYNNKAIFSDRAAYEHEEQEFESSTYGQRTASRRHFSEENEEYVVSPNRMMDTYSVAYNESAADDNEADLKENTIMLPAYDQYSVSAEGMNGIMSPQIYASGKNNVLTGLNRVLNRNTYKKPLDIKKEKYYDQEEIFYTYKGDDYDPYNTNSDKIHFYFQGDYESYLRALPGTFAYNSSGTNIMNITSYSASSNTITTNSNSGYNSTINRRASGKFVEWFTNNEIIQNKSLCVSKGFIEIDSTIQRNNSTYFEPDGIGAFTIYTESGMAYHYSLPVYQYETFIYSKKPNDDNVMQYIEIRDLNKYATHWLLTAVTGPDYIDKNNNGLVDKNDYGYWIEFNYGKWSDGYIWKIPYDFGENDEFSWGRKQIYYLNSICTRTHTAYFIKKERQDGKGIGSIPDANGLYEYKNRKGSPPDKCDIAEWACTWREDKKWNRNVTIPNNECHKTLFLDKIILVKNDVILNSSSSGSYSEIGGHLTFQPTMIWKDFSPCLAQDLIMGPLSIFYDDACSSINTVSETGSSVVKTFGDRYIKQNVLMDDDITNETDLYQNALKVIEFDYDYSLCPATPNSTATNQGKLTLTKVRIKGEKGVQYLPEYTFNYSEPQKEFNMDSTDYWGYHKTKPESWSLNQILTPLGSELKILYESDKYHSVLIPATFDSIGNNTGGIRVKEILVNENTAIRYKTVYSYSNGSTVWEYSDEETASERYIPYITELPAPIIMYPNVSVCQYGNDNTMLAKNTYTFYVPSNANSSGTNFSIDNDAILKIYDLQNASFSSPTGITDDDMCKTTMSYIKHVRISCPIGFLITGIIGPCLEAITVNEILSTDDFTNFEYNNTRLRSIVIEDKLAAIGRILSTETYNTSNDRVSAVNYYYKDPSTMDQGVHQETFRYYKQRDFWDQCHEHKVSTYIINATSRVVYPSVLDHIESITPEGITYSYNVDFDPVSGNVLTVRNVLPNGDEYVTKNIPAYQLPAGYGSEMGPKSANLSNKNMLTQNAATLVYKKINGVEKVINASIQTWNGDWNNYVEWDATNQKFTGTGTDPTDIWRKHKTFAWNGDVDENGAYGSDFDPYASLTNLRNNWNSYFGGEGISKWIKTSEVARYDHYSSPVEVKDINGNYASVKKDGHSAYTIASAALASYASFTATGFEDMARLGNPSSTYYNLGGEVVATISSSTKRLKTDEENGFKAHTGEYMFKLAANATGPKYKAFANQGLQTGIKYRASVWVHKNSAGTGSITAKANGTAISGATSTWEGPYGDWKLLNTDFNVAAGINDIEVSLSASGGNVYFDDFRVSPYKAAMSAYTYDNAGNVTAILDNNNHAVRYTYDKAGRLVQTERETEAGFKKTATHQYNYNGRLSVTPNTPKSTSNAGTEILTYDVLNSSGITYTLQLPSWIEQISKTATSFSVKPEANLTACDERSGNIVVSVPQVGSETIQVVQEEAPAYHSIQVKSGGSVPENNILYTGNTYHVFFEYCDDVSHVDVMLYQYDSPTSTEPYCGHAVVNNSPLSAYTTYDGFILTIGETPPSGCPSWNAGAYYRVRIRNHNDYNQFVESGNFRILHPPNPPSPPAYLHFTNEPASTFIIDPTTTGGSSYQYVIHWDYTDPQYDYLTFTLEVCKDETAYPCIKEINLPPQSDAYYHTLSQLRQLTWSFTEGDIVDAIKNVMPVAYRADHYVYRIIAKKYGCTSNCPSPAYSRYFFISGLSITWP